MSGLVYCLIGMVVFFMDIKITKLEKGHGEVDSEPIVIASLCLVFVFVTAFWPLILLCKLWKWILPDKS